MISTHPESNNAWGKSRSFKPFSHGKEAKNNVFPGFRAHRSGDFPPRAPSAPHAALRRHPRWALTRHTYSAAGIPMPSGSAAIPASGSPPASASINAFCAKHAPVCGGHTRADPIIAVPRRTTPQRVHRGNRETLRKRPAKQGQYICFRKINP